MIHRFFLLALTLTLAAAHAENFRPGVIPAHGADLLPIFIKAHAGQPLRVAAMGGSITQDGAGWIEPWLREQFPRAAVTMRNAGMSATGSELGIFRMERDVIAAQPDLVLIEFVVNDGGSTDVDAIRYLESIVVRLKSLQHPPAIVFLGAAAKGGSNQARHRQVAEHYGLLYVDLQEAVDKHLSEAGEDWSSLMGDSVHPNKNGHALYARTIAAALDPYVKASSSSETTPQIARATLPPPISRKPLLLDGRLVPLDPQAGWRKEHFLSHWWSMFFNGVITADQPGSSLLLSARGTMLGVFYALEKDVLGSFAVNVDGGELSLIDCAYRSGYTFTILGRDLEPCEHAVRVAVARPLDRAPGPVKLGFLLVAGDSSTTDGLASQGSVDPAADMVFAPIPARQWQWSGPFGGETKTTGPTIDLETVFAPETPGQEAGWKPLEGEKPAVDFAGLTGRSDRGVCYARTTLQMARAGQSVLALRLDYFGKLWVNGELAKTIDTSHGPADAPLLIPVSLKEGDNEILLKVHSGSGGNRFAMFFSE